MADIKRITSCLVEFRDGLRFYFSAIDGEIYGILTDSHGCKLGSGFYEGSTGVTCAIVARKVLEASGVAV